MSLALRSMPVRNLRRRGTCSIRLEFQGLYQARRNHFGRGDHSCPLEPDVGFRAADVMPDEDGSILKPQHIGLSAD